jgi:hypothetical protein
MASNLTWEPLSWYFCLRLNSQSHLLLSFRRRTYPISVCSATDRLSPERPLFARVHKGQKAKGKILMPFADMTRC